MSQDLNHRAQLERFDANLKKHLDIAVLVVRVARGHRKHERRLRRQLDRALRVAQRVRHRREADHRLDLFVERHRLARENVAVRKAVRVHAAKGGRAEIEHVLERDLGERGAEGVGETDGQMRE